MTLRVWRRSDASDERVVLGVDRPRSVREVPSVVPRPAEPDSRDERVASLEERLRTLTSENAALHEQLEPLQSGLEQEYQNARANGHEAGLREGAVKVQKHLEHLAASWKASAEEMVRLNEVRLQALRTEISDVVLAAVSKFLGEQLANPQLVRASTEQLLKESGVTAPVRVLLSPIQHEQLLKSGGAPLAWFRDRRLEIAADERVQHGGCLIETANGVIDGRFEVQLEKLRQVLASHYKAATR